MAIREILVEGDPALRKVCKPVAAVDGYVHRLLDDMLETMRKEQGVGLAAPQVGVLRRVVVIEKDDVVYELINPEMVSCDGSQTDVEGCLSVPGRAGMVERPQKVTVRAQNREGVWCEYTGEDLLARAFCHELDHLDGKLYLDIMQEEVDLNETEDEQSSEVSA